MVLIIADSIESWTEFLSYPTTLRVLVSAIGYTFRPLCILNIILITMRGMKIKYWLLYLPAVINAIISFSALFTDIAFSYSDDNKFIRGPLGISAYVVCILYLLLLLLFSIHYLKERHIYESIIIFIINFMAVLSICFEVIFKLDGVINSTYAVSITFYYLFFHTQTTKRDVLTQAFNRRCFYDDAKRDALRIKALISFDLNNLKVLNDTKGHACGDEFAIICLKHDQKTLEDVIQKLRSEISKTPYSCAFGLAMITEEETFDSLCKRADALMYEDKIRIKGFAR